MTTTLLIAILMAFSATYPDVRIEWHGKFVAPSQIIKELKIMEEQENKPIEKTETVTPAEETPVEKEGPKVDGLKSVNA